MTTTTLYDLPCELVAAILINLDDVSTLLHATLTCRHIYHSFKEIPGIVRAVFHSQIPADLLPYCVAQSEAKRLAPKLRRRIQKQTSQTGHYDGENVEVAECRRIFEQLHNEPDALLSRLPALSSSDMWRIVKTYKAIDSLARQFAEESWALLRPGHAAAKGTELSPTEHVRFCRAFYRLDICYQICTGRYSHSRGKCRADTFTDRLFVNQHSDWECTQVACAYDFLEQKLCKASDTIVASGSLQGVNPEEYWFTAAQGNRPKNIWMTQGAEFIHDLTRAERFEDRRDMLQSALGCDYAHLFSQNSRTRRIDWSLYDLYHGWRDSDEDVLDSCDDSDRGPFMAYFSARQPRNDPLYVGAGWQRDRAYVLWDWQRIQEHRLLEYFSAVEEKDGLRPVDRRYETFLEEKGLLDDGYQSG